MGRTVSEGRQVYLDLAPGVSVGVDFEVAMSLDRKGFARLYRAHVHGAKRREAKRWAERQWREREAILWAAT